MTKPIQSGFYDAKYLFVGEAPGEEEHIWGRPLIGVSGSEFYRMMEEAHWFRPGTAKRIIDNLHPWYDPETGRMRISRPNFLFLDQTLESSSIFITNVIHERPPNNEISRFFYGKQEAKRLGIKEINGRYPNEIIIKGMKQLYNDINKIKPIITIALGGTALWALTGLEGITKWRGSILEIDESTQGKLL